MRPETSQQTILGMGNVPVRMPECSQNVQRKRSLRVIPETPREHSLLVKYAVQRTLLEPSHSGNVLGTLYQHSILGMGNVPWRACVCWVESNATQISVVLLCCAQIKQSAGTHDYESCSVWYDGLTSLLNLHRSSCSCSTHVSVENMADSPVTEMEREDTYSSSGFYMDMR